MCFNHGFQRHPPTASKDCTQRCRCGLPEESSPVHNQPRATNETIQRGSCLHQSPMKVIIGCKSVNDAGASPTQFEFRGLVP